MQIARDEMDVKRALRFSCSIPVIQPGIFSPEFFELALD
jgi:hypothetical protein